MHTHERTYQVTAGIADGPRPKAGWFGSHREDPRMKAPL